MLHSPRSPLCQTEEKILSAVGDAGLARAQLLCGEHFSMQDLQQKIAQLEDGADRRTLSTIMGIVRAEQAALLRLYPVKKTEKGAAGEMGL